MTQSLAEVEDTRPKPELVWFAFNFKRKCWARAYLNGLPAFKDTKFGPDGGSTTANDLLVPGENVLSIEVLRVEDISFVEDDWQVRADIYSVTNLDDPTATRVKRAMRRSVAFPRDMYPTVAERFRRVPFYYSETIDLTDANILPPPWTGAPDAAFGHEGTPELREAVARLHHAIDSGDTPALLAEIALKLNHFERSHGGHPAYRASAGREAFKDVMSLKPRPRPLDFSELHFEPLHNGRVAKVTRLDRGWVIDAQCEKDPRRSLEFDLLLIQEQGSWRIFV